MTQQRLAILAKVSAPTISRFESGEKDIQLSSILNILGVLGMVDQRNLLFSEPQKAYYDPDREVIIFWGHELTNNKKIQCIITREALDDHYKSTNHDPVKIFQDNRAAIEHEARRKYLENRLETDNSIQIKTTDL